MNATNSNLLLVDADRARIHRLAELLEGNGYSLETVVDPDRGWALLEADPGRFDAVLLDSAASCEQRTQFIERVRRHPLLQAMPLILQTGPDGEHKGLDGASRLRRLHRPFDQAKLLDIVSVALRERVYCRKFKADTGELREATFTFQTIHSARDLAILLAATFPEPQRVVVGLTELLLNAVEHGNLGIGYGEKNRLRHEGRWELEVAARAADPANTGKEVWVEYLHEPRHIKVRIRDQGDGFDWRSYLDMDPARVNELHGRGIAIARMISFDSLEYRGNGNEVEVAVEIPAR